MIIEKNDLEILTALCILNSLNITNFASYAIGICDV
jgi:hypothetical protein